MDRTDDDPRTGMFSDRLVALLRGGPGVVCVLNRKGRARLLACAACRTLARCERCESAVEQDGDVLRCRRCSHERPVVCRVCGAQRMKTLRAGVTRARGLERARYLAKRRGSAHQYHMGTMSSWWSANLFLRL